MNKGTYVKRDQVPNKTSVEGKERLSLFLILHGTALILPQLGFSYLLLFPHEQANKNCSKEIERRAKVESEKKKKSRKFFFQSKRQLRYD